MKRWIAILLAALLALAASAQAATGDMVLGRDDEDDQRYFRYCFSDGDMLYLSGYGDFSTFRLGDDNLKDYSFEIPEEMSGNGYEIQYLPFISEGTLYAIVLYSKYDEYSEFLRAALCTLTLDAENGVVKAEEQRELDWSDMVEYYGESSYANTPDGLLAMGGKLLIHCYSEANNLYVLDISNGIITRADDLDDAVAMAPYKDGEALIEQFEYGPDNTVHLTAYDPESGSVRPLAEFEAPGYGPVSGLVYDPEGDAAYCIKGGEVCPLDLATGEIGEGIADMPLETYSDACSACVLTGGYYVLAKNGVAIRSLNPDTQAESRLKICDASWSQAVNDVYFRFANSRGDVRVVLSHDDANNVIENMMNRDSSVDIYVLSSSSPDYEAVYNRGYMLELDDCEKVRAFIDSAYPSLAESLMYKGCAVALPVDAHSYTMGVNERALNSIGLQLSDVPTNWEDFLAFLNTLPEHIGEDSKVAPFYRGTTIEDLKMQLFYMLFENYQRYVNATDPAMGYNTDLMRRLMAALDAVDFESMGYAHQEEDENGGYTEYGVSSDDESTVLFEVGVGCSFGSFYGYCTPLLMAMDADTPAIMTLETMMAFVNPFTENPEAAKAFMEMLAENLPDNVKYSFNPELNEPIRGEYNERNIRELETELENQRALLETAEPEEKQELEEIIRQWEETLADAVENGWDVGQRDIDWYRANDDHLVIAKANWLYSDGAGEAWELLNQYQAGQISGEEMLAGIDKKVQMMLMEGN